MSNRSVPVLNYGELRHRRIAAGMSQADLAIRAGCTSGYVSLMERGLRQAPSAHTLAHLAGALGCKITDLMIGNGTRS